MKETINIRKNRIKEWVLNHDNCKVFIILYISLAVVLSLLISLFWLVLVVLIHFLIEILRQYFLNDKNKLIILNSLWETKLDIALVLFALCLGVYMDFVFGIAGIGAGVRSVAHAGSRFALWQRIIRGILISLDDIAQLVRFTGGKKDKNEASTQNIPESEYNVNYWKLKWSKADYISVFFGMAMLLLIVFAPIFTEHSLIEVISIMKEDLKVLP